MYGAVYLPQFHLQAQLRRGDNDWWNQPVALLNTAETGQRKDRGKARVIELTPTAARQGVELGMRASQAQARCGRLRLLTPDPVAAEAAQEDLLDRMGRFSPDIEATQAGVCIVDLFGGRLANQGAVFAQKARETLVEVGLKAQAGSAGNPGLALLAARIAQPALVMPDAPADVRARLSTYPLDILAPEAEVANVLRLWGIRCLGDLRALPRAELTERLGAAAGRLWDLADGGRFRLLTLVRAPTAFIQEMDLDYEVETLEPLLILLRRMLETLAGRLAAAYAVAGNLRLTLRFTNGPDYEREFQVPDPCREVDLLFRMLHTHLDSFTAAWPVCAVRLEAVPSRPVKRQAQLFEGGLKDPNRFAETLARLEGLLGPGRIGRPQVLDSHRPDAVEVKSYEAELDRGEGPGEDIPALGLPLRRFRPPLPVRVWCEPGREAMARPAVVHDGRRWKHLAVTDCLGPWRMSGDWWDTGRWDREEWDVALEHGELCRLVQMRGRWFMEGIYE